MKINEITAKVIEKVLTVSFILNIIYTEFIINNDNLYDSLKILYIKIRRLSFFRIKYLGMSIDYIGRLCTSKFAYHIEINFWYAVLDVLLFDSIVIYIL